MPILPKLEINKLKLKFEHKCLKLTIRENRDSSEQQGIAIGVTACLQVQRWGAVGKRQS